MEILFFKTNIQKLSIIALSSIVLFTSCKKDEVTIKEPAKAETVKDLAADPTTVSSTGQPVSAGKYTFFSFKNGTLTSADSASNKWDVAFKGTTILTNGGTSGVGQGAASILNGIFDEINNIVDANKILAKNGNKFVLGQQIYYRIYSEKQYVSFNIEIYELLAKTALLDFNAPFMY